MILSLRPLLLLSGLLCGCNTGINTPPQDTRPNPTDEDTAEDIQDSAEPDPVEECDGIDNDGDGQIDEGFDANADGVGDCLQCAVDSTDAVSKGTDAQQCLPREQRDDSWQAELAWRFTYSKEDNLGACVHPRAADIDQDGYTDIICNLWYSVRGLYAISGRTQALLWDTSDIKTANPFSIADIDGDGEQDIITLTPDDRLSVISRLGVSGY
ncbi:MAG: hypothetical protein ACI8S6_002667, partial [Myxococcota bacterium]